MKPPRVSAILRSKFAFDCVLGVHADLRERKLTLDDSPAAKGHEEVSAAFAFGDRALYR